MQSQRQSSRNSPAFDEAIELSVSFYIYLMLTKLHWGQPSFPAKTNYDVFFCRNSGQNQTDWIRSTIHRFNLNRIYHHINFFLRKNHPCNPCNHECSEVSSLHFVFLRHGADIRDWGKQMKLKLIFNK